ncbi:phosphotransferase family protein [Aspergillus homomorphus CBS 101889]|uniref:Aminoglycoside phosphotransferase domain-containing protein n=1 Tax=Aspergillus homomorphus (strain CBS 101889) TaxID=1450537 RepID=A0A395HUT7_ASPHC|nr:hypothetical protein BO97DRAFT_454112 [Aspergillus homomorphus CBS 101889]RAL11560.1 hypothetical protein BO97DRAFT_454112 [Aspergillus homomorphus CBS 101889]
MSSALIYHDEKPDDEFVQERFGELMDITNEALVKLAVSVRSKYSTTATTTPTAWVLQHWLGTYNLIHIVEFSDGLKYVIRVPASARHGQMTETARRALTAQAHMMRFVKKSTRIPMPDVLDFNTGFANPLKAPYIVMAHIPGRMVAEAWFDRSGPVPLEEKRLRILDSVAEAMAQLRGFQFEQIGSIEEEGGSGSGEEKEKEKEKGNKPGQSVFQIEQFGPFTSSAAYLRNRLQRTSQWQDDIGDRGSRVLLDLMIECLPLSTKRRTEPRESFVLSIPDLSAKNVLIDDHGAVTGFVDWDDAHTMPRFLGYTCFPHWITPNLNMLRMGLPKDKDHEDPPELLMQYRRRYNRKMQALLRGVGDARFVNKSHIYSAVHFAICHQSSRLEIVCWLVARAFPTTLPAAMKMVLSAGQGKLSTSDKDQLTIGFQALFSIYH